MTTSPGFGGQPCRTALRPSLLRRRLRTPDSRARLTPSRFSLQRVRCGGSPPAFGAARDNEESINVCHAESLLLAYVAKAKGRAPLPSDFHTISPYAQTHPAAGAQGHWCRRAPAWHLRRRHPRPGPDIIIAGQPVEIAVSSVSPDTVRITVRPHLDGARRRCRSPARSSGESFGAALASARGGTARRVRAGNLVGAIHTNSADDSRRDAGRRAGAALHARRRRRPACRSCCRRARCSAWARAARSSTRRDRPIRCATAR